MAFYRKASSGKWEVTVEIGTHKRKRKSKRFKTKKEAQQWAASMELKKRDGLIIDAKNYTLKNLLKEWLNEYVSDKSPTTYDSYNMIVTAHIVPALGKIKLKDLHSRHIKNYINEKSEDGKINSSGGLSGTTLLHHYHVFSSAFKYARKWSIMNHNPLDKIDPPKKSGYKAEYLSKNQIDHLLKTAKEISQWTYNFIYLAFKTGMRRGELLGLKWPNIEFNRKKISVRNNIVKTVNNTALEKSPKSLDGVRPIIVSDDVIDLLKKIRTIQLERKKNLGFEDENYIFCMDNGKKVIPRTAYNRYTKVFKAAKLSNFNFKSLRHTHATYMLQAGVHPKIVQERLGHSSIEVTLNIYSHVIPSLQKTAVAEFENYLSESDFKINDGEMAGK